MRTLDMVNGTRCALRAELDDFSEAFESAQTQGGPLDLADFLPDVPHPLYRDVLSELIRIDLEFSWKRGLPKRLEDYRPRFPEVFDDLAALQGIAFEEYRLRRLSGEFPSPLEYRERFGLPADDWAWL